VPVSVESVSSEPREPSVAARVNAASFEPLRRDDAATAPTPPRSALPLGPLAEPPSAATRNPGFPRGRRRPRRRMSISARANRTVPLRTSCGCRHRQRPTLPRKRRKVGWRPSRYRVPRPRVESEDVQPDPEPIPLLRLRFVHRSAAVTVPAGAAPADSRRRPARAMMSIGVIAVRALNGHVELGALGRNVEKKATVIHFQDIGARFPQAAKRSAQARRAGPRWSGETRRCGRRAQARAP